MNGNVPEPELCLFFQTNPDPNPGTFLVQNKYRYSNLALKIISQYEKFNHENGVKIKILL
jgi:hypothetical protein